MDKIQTPLLLHSLPDDGHIQGLPDCGWRLRGTDEHAHAAPAPPPRLLVLGVLIEGREMMQRNGRGKEGLGTGEYFRFFLFRQQHLEPLFAARLCFRV